MLLQDGHAVVLLADRDSEMLEELRRNGAEQIDLHLTVPDSHQAVHRTVGGEEGGQVAAVLLPGVVDELLYIAGIAHPASVPGDAHHDDIVFFAVDIFQH